MIILDAHQDIAYNALGFNRDYRQSALIHRKREGNTQAPATIGLPDALIGRVALVCATLFVAPAKSLSWKVPGVRPEYQNAQEAYTEAMKQMDYYQRLEDEDARVRIIRNNNDLDAVLSTWQSADEGADDIDLSKRQQGLILLMEGADPIIEPKQFDEWYERGVRIVGTSWKATRYAGGTSEPGGLTSLGFELLDVMASYNALLDLSHMAEKAFLESVDRYEGHLIASHSNPRKFVNTDRHLSDEMIRRLAERDGVMGVVLYNRFLSETWSSGDAKLPLSVVIDVIDHICQVTGSAAHVGIGSDFDGGFGATSIPQQLDTTGDLLHLVDALKARGYATDDIEGIMSGNMLRKIRACLP